MRQLEYQARVLDTLDAYLVALKAHKANANKVADVAADNPGLGITPPDFAKAAYDALRAAGRLPASRAGIPYSERQDGCARVVPNVTLKVPTGGGKTFLAVHSVSRIMGRYLGRDTGFVLWIVPNEAIYSQTLKRLKDRQDPYRQALDRAAAGRVRIMEKADRLDAREVESQLCVMVLMLQAANRQTQETLKMFQDRGDVHGFFPAEGEQQLHRAMLDATPNLQGYVGMFPMVKDSLGNALRLIRPVVVMDEGQKAVSDLAYDTLYGFNPLFVLELSATPKDIAARAGQNPRPARFANLLVEVQGRELDREGMIKMPMNLHTRQGDDWKATLAFAVAKLNELAKAADTLKADTGRYIRPIMLVQVERTGKDQREGSHIHSEDVKEWLLTAGFDEAEIAIKTAEQNDLSQPENIDLLSDKNRVRVIVTKQALQEGWDCPFAYVLCSLAASSNLSAMTQLVGRILRQPNGMKTGIAPLDECHVTTHRSETGSVVAAIKNGLENDGLGDLVESIIVPDAGPGAGVSRSIPRRAEFASTAIYLPKVLRIEGTEARELDYETDLLSAIDWRGFDPSEIAKSIPENAQLAASQMQRITLAEDTRDVIEARSISASSAGFGLDPSHLTRMISDLVPNPFVGREIVERLLVGLRERKFDGAKLGGMSSLILDELRKGLEVERTARAEALFKSEVTAGRIQFRLRLDDRNWQMPFSVETSEPANARTVQREGGPLQRSLFNTIYEAELNADEQDVAVYLDKDAALVWWHRNVARAQYGLQGWKAGRIYPDFIFAAGAKGASRRITVLETKGDHLDNLDTAYKRDLMDFLSGHFRWDDAIPAGELELVQNTGETVECVLILMSEWKTNLPPFLAVN